MKLAIKLVIFVFILSTYSNLTNAAPTQAQIDQQVQIMQRLEDIENAKRLEEERQERLKQPEVKLQEDKKKTKIIELPQEEVSFYIKKIQVQSTSKQYPFTWLQKLVLPYQDKKIGVEGMNLIAQMLTEQIVNKGYVTTRITVPEQDLTTGTLIFEVVPGLISDIRFKEPNNWGTWRTAFPTRKNKLLNIKNLEQGLEQMKRVANQDVQMELVPGEQLGYSDVVITLKRTKPWSISFSLDDSNLKSMGRLQGSGSLTIHNPTGLNDTFSFTHGRDAQGQSSKHGTKNYNVSYFIPYGNYTFNLSNYRSTFYQTVPSLIPFKSSSETETFEFGIQRLLYRDKMSKTQLSLKLMKKDRRSYIDNTEILVQRQHTSAYQLGISHRQYIGKSSLDIMFNYQKGVPWFGAQKGIGDGDPGSPTSLYNLFSLNMYFAVPFKIGAVPARYNLNIRGQYTKDILYSSEQFSIGGRYSVRGFDGEQTLNAENGYYIRNEIAIPLKKVPLEIYAGIDYGRVWGSSDIYLPGNSLAGAVFGLRGNLLKQVQFDCFIGTPIYKPKGLTTAKTALGFQIYWSF